MDKKCFTKIIVKKIISNQGEKEMRKNILILLSVFLVGGFIFSSCAPAAAPAAPAAVPESPAAPAAELPLPLPLKNPKWSLSPAMRRFIPAESSGVLYRTGTRC